jgi:putative ABC transport system substrate-binding protein
MRLIGVLMGYVEDDPIGQSLLAAFRGALSKLGWKEGSNLGIEVRWGAADPDRTKMLAKELVDLRPDAIVGQSTLATSALASETRTIPIVFAVVADPIGNGFIASLARPGGNLTGFTALDPELGGKWVGLLKEIAPRTDRVALLFNPATAMPFQFLMPSIQAAASSFGVEVSATPVRAKDEIEVVIAAQARTPGGGLIVMPDVFNLHNRHLIIALAAHYAIPAMYFNPTYFVGSGGLIGYSDDYEDESRLAAGYVDRILKGEKPATLPVQHPTKYQLIINLQTAKAL